MIKLFPGEEEGNARVYLTRRNLMTLLSKLDRVKAGQHSFCAIVKGDTIHEKYPCTHPTTVIAIEDEEYYDRPAGEMHPADDPSKVN